MTFQVIILPGFNRRVRRSEQSRITCVQPLCSKNHNYNSYYQDLLWIFAQCRKIQYKQLIILLLPMRRIILGQINISEIFFFKAKYVASLPQSSSECWLALLSAFWIQKRAGSVPVSDRFLFIRDGTCKQMPCWSNLSTRRDTVGGNLLGSLYLNVLALFLVNFFSYWSAVVMSGGYKRSRCSFVVVFIDIFECRPHSLFS